MTLRLAFAGDFMCGRGVDQVLKFPSDSQLYESNIKDAKDYVHLIASKLRQRNLSNKILFWKPLLPTFQKQKPHVFFINLETAITASKTPEAKGINYKMNPKNIYFLKDLEKDIFPCKLICGMANNHTLDWQLNGLK